MNGLNEMMQEIVAFLIGDGAKLGLAVVLGGAIGLEREASDKPAGLRTNILICVGSTLMMILSVQVAHHYAVTVADPGRIAQGVITGIGFLGAGTILHSRGGITGLTTAATTWAVAGIGLALGSGFYGLAAATTLLILAVLWILGRASREWGKGTLRRLRVVTEDPVTNLDAVRSIVEKEGASLLSWNYRRLREGHCVILECEMGSSTFARILSRISSSPGIRSARSL